MSRLKGIKRLANYGLITLIGFNLFIGCEDSNHIEPIEFVLESNLTEDSNGFYHLEIDTSVWQTLHRISGSVYVEEGPVELIRFNWYSSHYWYIGDTLGYVVEFGLTDDLEYVSYDTNYVTWFNGSEVPTTNCCSYSNSDGEVNNMIAPVQTMIGDTMTISYTYRDYSSNLNEGEVQIVLD